ncbi:MAG: STT3 domain-containing protein, partial [Nanoarchaeota archaeon]
LVTVNPVVLSRSLGSDNDIVNAVFPLLVMLFVIYAFDSKTTKDTIIYSAITGLLLGVYSFAWSGWWFMFLFIIVSLGIYLGYIVIFDIIDKEKNIKDIAKNKTIHRIGILVGVYLIATFISLAIFGNAGEFINSFTNPLNILSLKEAARGINIWPNVYTTVAELNSAGIEQIINSIGGMLFFWVALVGSLLFFTNFKEKKHNLANIVYIIGSAIYFFFLINITTSGGMTILSFALMLSIPMFVGLMLSLYYKYELEPMHSILMVVWFMATIYSVTKGVRFILLIVPIFAVSFGTFFGILVDKVSNSIAKALDMDIKIPKISLFILLALIIIPSIRTGVAVSSSYTPGINDAWVESLEKIKSQSQPDAIINSWWDFGHWFKYFADRAVTSDGASQNSQQAHWVGKVLLTGDEEQAIAILRMLDCGGTDAESELTKITGDTYLTVNMLYRFFEMDESGVRKELLTITSEEKTEKILSYMFCEPPEDYFITSQDMVGKAGVWAHFGIWDFKRAKIYSYHKTQTFSEFTTSLVDELGYTQQQAQTIYYEISALTSDSQINNWIAKVLLCL